MQINKILNNINAKLAGELLSYSELETHLDDTIDDINEKLSSKFPAFSEFTAAAYPQYPNYDFLPDSYIRSVICLGAAYKFYLTDEEGMTAAIEYGKKYASNLFVLQRDYSDKVPEAYRDYERGSLKNPDSVTEVSLPQLIWGDV